MNYDSQRIMGCFGVAALYKLMFNLLLLTYSGSLPVVTND